VCLQLTFADHVHQIDAGDDRSRAPKTLEAEHRSGDVFDGAPRSILMITFLAITCSEASIDILT